MFENIIGYEREKEHWRGLAARRALPSALCIAGRPQSARSSCALEIARGILCDGEGAWGCLCENCMYMRLLEHENILMMGARDFLPEIYCARDMAAADTSLSGQAGRQASLFFYRAVLKLLRRADELLWEDTPAWSRGIKTAAEGLQAALTDFREECVRYAKGFDEAREADARKSTAGAAPKKTGAKTGAKAMDAIVKQAEKLYAALPAYLYPIGALRNALAWTQVRGHGTSKIILLEAAESLHEASANALLKTLEEPPAHVFFMLITTHPSALLPTVRSRVRLYALPPRPAAEEAQVMEKIFRSPDAHLYAKNTAEFLSRFKGGEVEEAQEVSGAAEQYAAAFLRGARFEERFVAFVKNKAAKQEVKLFFQALHGVLHSMLLAEAAAPQLVRALYDRFRAAEHNILVKNMAAEAVIETLYYACGHAAAGHHTAGHTVGPREIVRL